jgi:hypothetical protein
LQTSIHGNRVCSPYCIVFLPDSLQKHCFVGFALKPIHLNCRRTFLRQNNDECTCNSRSRLSRGADAKGDFPPYASAVGIVNSFFRRGGSSFSRRALNYGGGAMRCRNVGLFSMSRNADQIALLREGVSTLCATIGWQRGRIIVPCVALCRPPRRRRKIDRSQTPIAQVVVTCIMANRLGHGSCKRKKAGRSRCRHPKQQPPV